MCSSPKQPIPSFFVSGHQHYPDNAGEKEQRIVSLTAQLTTARMKEAVSERRYCFLAQVLFLSAGIVSERRYFSACS